MAPLLFLGGTARKPLEQVVDVATKQLAKGKTAEEAVNIAYQQAAKKGWIKVPAPKVAPKAVTEAVPVPEVPVIAPKAPLAKPIIKPPLAPLEDPVMKLTNLVKAAKPVRAETELLKQEELSSTKQ